MTTFDEDVRVTGNALIDGDIKPLRARAKILLQENAVPYPLPLAGFFIDTTGQPLPSAAAGSNLALSPGTFGTGNPVFSAGDLKAAGATTRRARTVARLPAEYVAGETVSIRVAGGMGTTAADGSCTVLVEAYKVGRNGLVSGTNLVTTGATTINNTTFAEKNFAVTSSGLSPGDQLDIRVSITCTDTATVTAVIPEVASVDLMLDIQG